MYLVIADSGIFIQSIKINTLPISKYRINMVQNNQKKSREILMQLWKCTLNLKNN